jgi:hypothetical protein
MNNNEIVVAKSGDFFLFLEVSNRTIGFGAVGFYSAGF